jgi:hypothetical protein
MALLCEISLSLKRDSEMSHEISDILIKINQVDVKWGISQFYRPYHIIDCEVQKAVFSGNANPEADQIRIFK